MHHVDGNPHVMTFPTKRVLLNGAQGGLMRMRRVISQIFVGVIVTVFGTVIADTITRGSHGVFFKPGYHASMRGGR